MKQDTVILNFTGLSGFPINIIYIYIYIDLGWGKPLWVGRVSLPFKNLVTFIDTKFGDGIEAWINLKEEDMAKFERDKELLSCVSTTLS